MDFYYCTIMISVHVQYCIGVIDIHVWGAAYIKIMKFLTEHSQHIYILNPSISINIYIYLYIYCITVDIYIISIDTYYISVDIYIYICGYL